MSGKPMRLAISEEMLFSISFILFTPSINFSKDLSVFNQKNG